MTAERKNALPALLAALAMVAVWSTPLAAQDALTLFKTKCAMCHGPDGKGETPMGKKLDIHNLGAPEVQKQTDAELNTIIAKGKGKMAPFGAKLTPEQIGQLVAHIRELGKK